MSIQSDAYNQSQQLGQQAADYRAQQSLQAQKRYNDWLMGGMQGPSGVVNDGNGGWSFQRGQYTGQGSPADVARQGWTTSTGDAGSGGMPTPVIDPTLAPQGPPQPAQQAQQAVQGLDAATYGNKSGDPRQPAPVVAATPQSSFGTESPVTQRATQAMQGMNVASAQATPPLPSSPSPPSPSAGASASPATPTDATPPGASPVRPPQNALSLMQQRARRSMSGLSHPY